MTGDAIDEYLARHRIGAAAKAPVQAPRTLRPMTLHLLETALADPARVVDESGQVADRSADRLTDLMRLALWLRQAPEPLLPAALASRAARYRFLVWTLPVRLDWPVEVHRVDFGDTGLEAGRREILAEARAARTDWLRHLDSWEDDPWLAARQAKNPTAIEDDLRWVTATWVGPGRPTEPLSLDLDEPRADHEATAQLVVEQHWIVRSAVGRATEAFFPGRGAGRAITWIWPLCSLLPALLLGFGPPEAARVVAVVVLLCAVLAAGVARSCAVILAMPRVPAAVVVGQAVLLGLTPRWWVAGDWRVGLSLLVGAGGYLVYESRSHGSPPGRAVRRGAALLGVATCHAVCISIAVLGFVAPAVAEDGGCLDGWWDVAAFAPRSLTPACADALNVLSVPSSAAVVTLMVGWSVAVGLAAQVLWDDRPISAPLGRVRRVRGAS